MFRGFRHGVAARYTRCISIGGRRSRGGFSQPLGKHVQVKQGVVEGVPRRIPGTTKVTYTNKKGRTFTFSIPVTEITHPQINLTNASGSWREMDTSFSDLGDMEDDMPSPVDDCLQTDPEARSLPELCESFVSFCREYVLMDTSGMRNTILCGELNVGPDYEHYDRRLKRKRHWLAIRHRFEDVRVLIWPEKDHETENLWGGAPLSVGQMLDALLWLEAASTFCFRKVQPSDLAERDEFLPLDLHREVTVVARHVGGDPIFFSASPNGLERFSACAALCANHGVAFSLFFGTQNIAENALVSDESCILANLPPIHGTFDAIRIMSIIEGKNDNTSYVFSDAVGEVVRPDILQGLSRLMSTKAFGSKDALENISENELCILMRFCAEVREQNLVFFSPGVAEKGEGSSLVERYRQVSHAALARCRHLLYRLDGPRTQVMTEGGYIPLVDLQQHAERTNKDTLVHYNLGIRSAQGLRRVALGAQASARLAELVDRLEVTNTRVSGCTLLVDLVQHLSHKAASSKVSLTLKEVNTVLPLLARMRREAPTGAWNPRLDRLLAAIDSTIGAAMQQKCSVEEIVSLVEGLAACDILPSSFKQVEMVLLRIFMSQGSGLTHVTRILRALSSLLKSDVSQVLLQAAASHATSCIRPTSNNNNDNDNNNSRISSTEEVVQLIELLDALELCRYAALSGLVAFFREFCAPNDVNLSLKGRCTYASLLASAAAAMRHENEALSEHLASDSCRYFIEYAQSAQEEDLGRFALCVTGLTSVGFANRVGNDDTRPGLLNYLRSPCLSEERCAAFPSMVLATLLGSMLEWCVVLRVSPPDSLTTPVETVLLSRFRLLKGSSKTTESSEELDEVACRVVGLQHVSEDLRKAAAEALGRAIVRAEAAADTWKPAAEPGRSFEVVALSGAERENNHKNALLRYCTALQQSGMVRHVEELVL